MALDRDQLLTTPGTEPSPDEKRQALRRVLADERFRASRRASDFLEYVVHESLAGRADDLSERRVGRYALMLPHDAVARESSLVRVHATRLRRLLELYYEGPGEAEPVRIVLPAGQYAPRFVRRHLLAVEPIGPRVLVTCAATTAEGSTDQVDRTCNLVARELRQFPCLRVALDVPESGGELPAAAADYVLTGGVGVNDHHHSATLVYRRTGDLVWTSRDEPDLPASDSDSSAAEWPTRVAARLGDYSGVVLRHHLHHPPDDPSPRQAALLAFCLYLEQGNAESASSALEAVDAAIEDATTPSSILLAIRASMLTAVVNTGGESRPDLLGQAEDAAREAIQLDPTLGHAHIALATASMLGHEWDLAVVQAHEAMRLSPTHPVILASAGSVLSAAGKWTDAAQAVRRAFELNPAMPPYAYAIPAIERLLAGDDETALRYASLIRSPGMVWGPLYRALALDGLGRTSRAEREMAEAVAVLPELADDPRTYLTAFWSWRPEELEPMVRRISRLASAVRTEAAPEDPPDR